MLKLQNLLIGTVLALLIILFQGDLVKPEFALLGREAEAQNVDVVFRNQAQLLTQQGHEQLAQGQTNQALASWERAATLYRKIHYFEGESGSLINQSLALRELGLNLRACNTLQQALILKVDVYGWLCNSSLSQPPEDPLKTLALAVSSKESSPVNVTALQNFGETLRLLGKTDESELVLQLTLDKIKSINSTPEAQQLLLGLANTEAAIFTQLRDKYSSTDEPVQKQMLFKAIQQKASLAVDLYIKLNTANNSRLLWLKSQLNRLNLLLSIEEWSAIQIRTGRTELLSFHTQIQNQINPLVQQLQQNSLAFSQVPANQSILAQLNFATSLSLIPGQQSQSLAIQYAQSALQVAEKIGSLRLKSSCFGVLGSLSDHQQAQDYLEKASSLAEAAQAWDLAWQWQQKLGNFYQEQGQYERAVQLFQAAINNLDKIRNNFLSINSDLQFSFREQVQPVYQQYMRLLLSELNPNLEQVIRTNEKLQIAELENFLQCGKLELESLSSIQREELPAIVHILDLGDYVETIVQSVDRSMHHHSVERNLVEININNLLPLLEDLRVAQADEPVYLLFSKALYKLLVAPLQKYLPSSGTLVFVLDSSFQGLPVEVLHNGTDFLVKHYSVALTLSSQLRKPKALHREQLRALIAGLSQESPSFSKPNAPQDLSALPQTLIEAASVKNSTASSTELLDQNFTTQRFQQEINKSNYPIVHISTHGQFSSDPQKTTLLDWNEALNLRQLNSFWKSRNQNEQEAIELLVLSACQTAKGDKRSTLGIAGIAAQAGARATVASLWLVDADSTASLMGNFYKNLADGLTKAEALRQAKLTLLLNPRYSNPYYWAGFILVGSWL